MLSPSSIGSGIVSLIHPDLGRVNGIVFIIILTTAVNMRSNPSSRKSLAQTPWDQPETSLAIY